MNAAKGRWNRLAERQIELQLRKSQEEQEEIDRPYRVVEQSFRALNADEQAYVRMDFCARMQNLDRNHDPEKDYPRDVHIKNFLVKAARRVNPELHQSVETYLMAGGDEARLLPMFAGG